MNSNHQTKMLSNWRFKYMKRGFDIIVAALGLALVWWLILIVWIVATVDTGANGLFIQTRIGRKAKPFNVFKIRTMRADTGYQTHVTSVADPRITRIGAFLRKTKIDELPQLVNILLGDMSFVGPRPDVPGYADLLMGEARELLLSVRPGLTGPATLVYKDEENLLALQDDPMRYNDEVIYPRKVQINVEYIRNWRLRDDVRCIWKTLVG